MCSKMHIDKPVCINYIKNKNEPNNTSLGMCILFKKIVDSELTFYNAIDIRNDESLYGKIGFYK